MRIIMWIYAPYELLTKALPADQGKQTNYDQGQGALNYLVWI